MIGSTYSISHCKIERVLNSERCGKGPIANPARKACTSFAIPEDCKTSCLYLFEIEILGGDPSAASATDTLLIESLGSLTTIRLLPTCEPKIRHRPVDDTSPQVRSHGATGGVCKKQGRILRAIVTRGY